MRALTKILEETRVLQLRNGVSTREALALVLAQQRRVQQAAGTGQEDVGPRPLQIQLPAASRLDALLPRDREPTVEEIREAWKECTEQSSLFGGTEHFEDVAEITPQPTWEDR